MNKYAVKGINWNWLAKKQKGLTLHPKAGKLGGRRPHIAAHPAEKNIELFYFAPYIIGELYFAQERAFTSFCTLIELHVENGIQSVFVSRTRSLVAST